MKKKRAILREVLKFKDLKKLDKKTFLKVWRAIAFLEPGLHPDGFFEPDSGWPKRLKPLATEAFRRFEIGEFTDFELYPASEALKGIKARRAKI